VCRHQRERERERERVRERERERKRERERGREKQRVCVCDATMFSKMAEGLFLIQKQQQQQQRLHKYVLSFFALGNNIFSFSRFFGGLSPSSSFSHVFRTMVSFLT
jgi:hypothetical protein